jgi:hypothetical protein
VPTQYAEPAQNVTVNVHPPAETDVYVLARMVSRELELMGKVS